jgi:hypothetical protein
MLLLCQSLTQVYVFSRVFRLLDLLIRLKKMIKNYRGPSRNPDPHNFRIYNVQEPLSRPLEASYIGRVSIKSVSNQPDQLLPLLS